MSHKYTELALLLPSTLSAPASYTGACDVSVSFITVGEDDKPRNLNLDWDTAPEIRGYRDLVLHTWIYSDMSSHESGELVYTELYKATCKSLEMRVKACKALERKIDKRLAETGHYSGFGEQLALVMTAAGIKRAFLLDNSNGSSSYDEQTFRSLNAANARAHVEYLISQWRKRYDKTSNAA